MIERADIEELCVTMLLLCLNDTQSQTNKIAVARGSRRGRETQWAQTLEDLNRGLGLIEVEDKGLAISTHCNYGCAKRHLL